jgi:DNA-binding protein HU-beta
MASKAPPAKPARKVAAKPAAAPATKTKKTSAPVAAKPAVAPVVTLKHLAAQLAEAHEMPKKQAEGLLDGIVGMFVDHLKAGDRLRINGLGVLEVKDRPARTGRNPATGAAIQIAASKKIAFRAAKELKEAI